MYADVAAPWLLRPTTELLRHVHSLILTLQYVGIESMQKKNTCTKKGGITASKIKTFPQKSRKFQTRQQMTSHGHFHLELCTSYPSSSLGFSVASKQQQRREGEGSDRNTSRGGRGAPRCVRVSPHISRRPAA